MEDNVITAKVLLTGIIVAGSAIWGWFGWLVLLWISCMVMDYVTGTLAAMKKGEWDSQKAREGLWHKGGTILVVLAAALTDGAISLILRSGIVEFPFNYSIALTVVALAWYTLTELGSMLENATQLTPHVPKWLTRFLKIAAQAVDEAGEKIAGEEKDHDDR